jgi:hypothetical protein
MTIVANSVIDGRLMPDTDNLDTIVVGASSGHARTAKSWVLGRLLRDMDDKLDKEMDGEAPHIPPDGVQDPKGISPLGQSSQKKPWEALRVSVYRVAERPPCDHGVPVLDWVWFSGFVVILVQLGISIIPWIIHKDWIYFLLTATGNSMAIVGASLPQWKEEKWACPKNGGATVTLTRGNGSRHAIVIKGKRGVGLDFEIMAQGTRTSHASVSTRFATGMLALLWIVFLITVSGIKQHTWCKVSNGIVKSRLTQADIVAIGLLGSMQNILVAGVTREPSALGVHLDFVETIRGPRVAKVLRELEEKHPSVGTSLLSVFFPGGLRAKDNDLDFWQEAMNDRLGPNKFGTRVDMVPPTGVV